MSRAQEVMHHESEAGWVVLTSQVPHLGGETPELAERLLERMDLSRPPVCITAADKPPKELPELLEEIETLLGVRPALMELGLEPPAELSMVSLMILAGGSVHGWVQALDNSLLGEVVLQALSRGAIILAIGPAAGTVGTWALPPEAEEALPGLGWVGGALVLPGETAPSELDPVRSLLHQQPKAYALALAPHTVVALGPGGEIEVWGEAQPTIILGQGWSEG